MPRTHADRAQQHLDRSADALNEVQDQLEAAPRRRLVEMTAHAYALLDSYVYGFALQQAALPFDGPGTVADVADPMMQQFPADAYPHLVEMATEYILQPGYDRHEFAIGLDMILDALSRSIPERGTEPE